MGGEEVILRCRLGDVYIFAYISCVNYYLFSDVFSGFLQVHT